MDKIKALLSDPDLTARIDREWNRLSAKYEATYASMPKKLMERQELSFHPFVKLLGFLCVGLEQVAGDIVEIGV